MTNPNKNKWDKMYDLATAYYNYHGNLFVPKKLKTINGYEYDEKGYLLGDWISNQKTAYKNRFILKEERNNTFDPLTDEQVDKLLRIGMFFGDIEKVRNEENWNLMYDLATSYRKYHGHLFVPQSFKTINGIDHDEKGYSLGTWISNQRQAYKNRLIPEEQRQKTYAPLTDEKFKKLLAIDMIFDKVEEVLNEYRWESMYKLAHAYYEHYGHLSPNKNFKTKNGIDYDKDGYSLKSWLDKQKIAYKNRYISEEQRKNSIPPLTDEKLNKLLEINMIFDIKSNKELCIELCMEYGINIKTYPYLKNNIPYKELNAKINFLLANKQPITKDNKIHKIFFMTNIAMQKEYNISKQELIKKYYKSIKPKKYSHSSWEKMYQLAKAYYNHYSHLRVPRDFTTNNGYKYDKWGYYLLGAWIQRQRTAYKNRHIPEEQRKNNLSPLTNEQVNKLLEIGMIFNPKENKQQCQNLCQEYEINTKTYPYLKDNISYKELNAKINFLLYNKEPIIKNNKIHKIFFMTNKKMIEIYNISKQELIEKYYKESMNRGR